MVTYAHIYNSFFSSVVARRCARRRDRRRYDITRSWIDRTLASHSHSVPARLAATRHLVRMTRTQSVAKSYLTPDLRARVHAEERLAHLAWTVSRLRPLQRRVLHRLWRPGGVMERRGYEGIVADLASATRSARDAGDRLESPGEDAPRTPVARAATGAPCARPCAESPARERATSTEAERRAEER